MLKRQGQSLQEYALIGFLVVVTSIGVLSSMGGNVSTMLGSVNENNGELEGLTGLLSSSNVKGLSPGAAKNLSDQTLLSAGDANGNIVLDDGQSLKLDSDANGLLSLTTLDANGKPNTTSSDGLSDIISKRFASLADLDDPAKPLTKEQKKFLKQLSQQFNSTANLQREYDQAISKLTSEDLKTQFIQEDFWGPLASQISKLDDAELSPKLQIALNEYEKSKQNYNELLEILKNNQDELSALDPETYKLIQAGLTIHFQNYVNRDSLQAKIVSNVVDPPLVAVPALGLSIGGVNETEASAKVANILKDEEIEKVKEPTVVTLLDTVSNDAGAVETQVVADDLKDGSKAK